MNKNEFLIHFLIKIVVFAKKNDTKVHYLILRKFT
jgi:hypothetical protein